MLLVIDNTYLFGEGDEKAVSLMEMGAQVSARGLPITRLEDSPELRARLTPWSERPDGVGGPKPTPESIARKLALAGPQGPGPAAQRSLPITRAPASGLIPSRVGSGWSVVADGREFRGGTPAEARLKAEAWLSLPEDQRGPAPATGAAPAAEPVGSVTPTNELLTIFERRLAALETAAAPTPATRQSFKDLAALSDLQLAELLVAVQAERKSREPPKPPKPPKPPPA